MPTPLGRIAEILAAINDPPNLRRQPGAGDLPGDFSEWFDGGAVRADTGTTSYHFKDHSVALIPVTPALIVRVSLPDGRHFTLQETG